MALQKKEFERGFQGGEVEHIEGTVYRFINNEENMYISFDLSNDEVKENSNTNLSDSQIHRIWKEVSKFANEQREDRVCDDEPMSHSEQYATFY